MNASSGRWPVRPRRSIASLLLIGLGWLTMPLPAAGENPGLSTTLTAVDPVEAPDFTLSDMDEVSHTLSDLRGNYVLVNFWATWCPPCRKEMPSLESLYQKYKDQGLQIVAVEANRDREGALTFIEENDLTYHFLEEVEDEDAKVVPTLISGGFPTSYLINREGRVVFAHSGFEEGDEVKIEEEIRKLL